MFEPAWVFRRLQETQAGSKVQVVGFESGGTVTSFKETVWSVSGTFGMDFASEIKTSE